MTLEGNPVIDILKSDDNDDSRKKILDLLPNLEVLDDVAVVKVGKSVNVGRSNLLFSFTLLTISEMERPTTSHVYDFNKPHSPDQIRLPQRPSSASIIGRSIIHHLTPIPNAPKLRGLY